MKHIDSWKTFRRLLGERRGNVAVVFALAIVPMILAVGAGVDYMQAYGVKQRMQNDLDAALIAAVKNISNADVAALKASVTSWFNAQADNSYVLDNIVIDTANQAITATASGVVPTTLMQIAGISQVSVQVVSSVKGPATAYLNVYIVIDKSPSMLLAATTGGQAAMYSGISCQFACHTGDAHTVGGVKYADNYAYSVAKGIKLRADVAVDAVKDVMDLVDEADASHDRIRVALYSLGDTATEVLSPTFGTTDARKRLSDDSYGLTSATSTTYTFFDVALSALQQKVGAAGDGSSSAKPLKLVLLLTDGVQSKREWVTDGVKWSGSKITTAGPSWNKVAPLNPGWCGYLKNQSDTVAVLYTEYLPITTDWGYNNTVGSTMASASWNSTWGGTMDAGVSTSITRRDYIPYALADCASSKNLFISASSSDDIVSGLSALFTQYLSSVRITK